MPYTKGSTHGPSIKNNDVYNALRRKGMDKGKAAAIANSKAKGRKSKRRKGR